MAVACWELPGRDYQYVAVDLLVDCEPSLDAAASGTVRLLIERRSWWDTVDRLASRVVGGLVSRHRQLAAEMDVWITDEDTWVVRAAILHQLAYGDRTDEDRLFHHVLRRRRDEGLFVRKAIGWALREYANTRPEAVGAFLARHEGDLAPLSVREARRHLADPSRGGRSSP